MWLPKERAEYSSRLPPRNLSCKRLDSSSVPIYQRYLDTMTASEHPTEKAVLRTSVGEMIFAFWSDVAPLTVANFKKLARSGFYDGTAFHRIIRGFMIQGGCPNTRNGADGTPGCGGPGYQIKAEFNGRAHVRGVISMARSEDPNSAGSQFFICHGNAPFLDNQYTAFGELIFGDEVLEKIASTSVRIAGGESSVPISRIELTSVHLVGSPYSSDNEIGIPVASGNAPVTGGTVSKGKGQKKRDLDQVWRELQALTGLSAVKTEVASLVNLIKIRRLREEKGIKSPAMSLHMVFTGNPGTGKTTIARLLSEIFRELGLLSKGHLTEVDRSGLVAGYVGQTAIKVTDVCNKALGGVLFIDEAYSLAGSFDQDYGHEAIETLLKFMEDNRDDIVVIVAGYRDKMQSFLGMNPGLRSRFNKFVDFLDYTPTELIAIFKGLAQEHCYVLGDHFEENLMSSVTDQLSAKGGVSANGRMVRNFFEMVIANHSNRVAGYPHPSEEELRTFEVDDLGDRSDRHRGASRVETSQLEAAGDPIARLSQGQICSGTVKELRDFGAFIDLNGVMALLHISDMTWGRIGHPDELLGEGEQIQVMVTEINRDKRRVSVGLKQLTPNPWDRADLEDLVGGTVHVKILSIVEFGAFVEIEPGLEGLIHVTEMSWSVWRTNPCAIGQPGREIDAVIIGVKRTEQKISLSVRRLRPNPWETLLTALPIGASVRGKISWQIPNGFFAEISEDVDGLIHVTDMTDPESVKIGEHRDMVVLYVDPEKQHLRLTLKTKGRLESDHLGTINNRISDSN